MRAVGLPAVLAALCVLLAPQGAGGGLYSDYQGLTSAEKRLALRYFWQLPRVKGAAEYARAESAAAYPQLSGDDDQRDALRHSLWNASLTRRLESQRSAERWATAHERWPGNPAARMAMDLENNRRGRELAWSQRRESGWWIFRQVDMPGDAALLGQLRQAVDAGGLVMIEEVGGQRDPQAGALVPTRAP